jgi:anti-anti-sigma factor
MALPIRPEDALFVDLPRGHGLRKKLREVSVQICSRGACNVVMNFSRVVTFDPVVLTVLLWLRQYLQDSGCRLIFCNVGPTTYKIFHITGLTKLFEICDRKSGGLVPI